MAPQPIAAPARDCKTFPPAAASAFGGELDVIFPVGKQSHGGSQEAAFRMPGCQQSKGRARERVVLVTSSRAKTLRGDIAGHFAVRGLARHRGGSLVSAPSASLFPQSPSVRERTQSEDTDCAAQFVVRRTDAAKELGQHCLRQDEAIRAAPDVQLRSLPVIAT
jgi:hypothetical protein